MRILYENESFGTIESYLKSKDLVDEIKKEFGNDYYATVDDTEVLDLVRDLVFEKSDYLIGRQDVIAFKIVDSDIDILEQVHTVVSFNGKYYDYMAQKFNEEFAGLIKDGNIPVTQNAIRSETQLRDNISSAKGYALLGY